MIAVIILPGPSSTMFGLDAKCPSSLLPLGDRPVLQHIVESLAAQRITSIEWVIGHAPERVEALLGNGDRWGCSFRYHLITAEDKQYRPLQVISQTGNEPWVLIHAEQYPVVVFPTNRARPVLYRRPESKSLWGSSEARSGICPPYGVVAFPPGDFGSLIAGMGAGELRDYFACLEERGEADVETSSEWVDASSPLALLETQSRLLRRKLRTLMISGIERQPGIWISRNVVIHPSVELVPPIYIGPNCRINRGARIGPDTVIGGHCIVDTNTNMEYCLAIGGSYIGEGLELSQSIVDQNLLVNARLGAQVEVSESFLLGTLKPTWSVNWFERAVQSLTALALIIIFLPILLISAFYFAIARRLLYTGVLAADLPPRKDQLAASDVRLPCLGKDAWSTYRPAGWSAFLRQFLPGLFAVLVGRIRLVGLPPRSTGEILQLPGDWRALYEEGQLGLITEASVAVGNSMDKTELYLADAYYVARQSWRHDLELAGKYIGRLIFPQSMAPH